MADLAPASSFAILDFYVKDNQAFTIITLNIRDSQIPNIQRRGTAKEAWARYEKCTEI